MAILQHTMLVHGAAEADRRGDETLHQVALGGTNVGLVNLHPGGTQTLFQLNQLTMLAAIQAQYRPLLEVTQLKRAQLHPTLTTQYRLCLLTVSCRNEGH
ncbi:hypothetical protein D3C72_2007550 [compost metagenome]